MGGRSDTVSRWKPEDLKKAREEWDPRLLAAISAYGPGKASSDNAAKLLVDLLQAPSTQSPTPNGAPKLKPEATPVAAPPAGAPSQLTTDAQGFTVIPNGVTVTLTEPYPIPAEISKMLNLPPDIKQLPAGFTLPADFKLPPGVQLPASAKITGPAQPAGGLGGPGGMLPPGMAPPRMALIGPPSEEEVVSAIVMALGANKTDTARSALRKLLKGELRTSISDATASGFAAKAMMIHPTEKEEAGLIAAAVNPSMIRGGGVAPAGLQVALLDALDDCATTKMRVALVDASLKPNASADQRKLVMAMVARPRPENMPAQARLFKNPKLDEALKKSLFEQFTAFSSAAIDQLLETTSTTSAPSVPATAMPDPAAPPKPSPNMQLDPKTLQAVIEGIWGPDVVERLKADGARSDAFEDFATQLPLAVVMPVSDARATLLGLVRESWVEGPEALAMGGTLGDRLRDPGGLLVVKRSPRLEKPPEKPDDDDKPDRPKRNRNQMPRRPGDEKKEKERKEKKEKEDKAHYAWMAASEELVHALNARFYAAAQSGGGQRHKISQDSGATPTTIGVRKAEPLAARFPLKLHEGAKISAEYHICLPEDLPESLRGVAAPALIVHYVRMEDVSNYPKVNSTYVSQLKGVTTHHRDDARWLDWMGPGVAAGMTRSVDVFVQRKGEAAAPAEGGKPKADDPVPVLTEILIIEIPAFRLPREEE
jgi:hypothetical protein